MILVHGMKRRAVKGHCSLKYKLDSTSQLKYIVDRGMKDFESNGFTSLYFALKFIIDKIITRGEVVDFFIGRLMGIPHRNFGKKNNWHEVNVSLTLLIMIYINFDTK